MTPFGEAIMRGALSRAFEFEDRRYQREMNALIDENDQILGRFSYGFNYRGQDYARDGYAVKETTILASPLIPKMVQIVHLRQNVEFDRKLATQLFQKLFEPLVEPQDMRDALPECLAALEPAFTGLPRTREPGWVLAGNPRDHRQFLKIMTKIEMYCALKYVY